MVIGLCAAALTGCGGGDGDASSSGSKVYKIGVSQFVEHTALNAAYQGFVDGLKEKGYEDGKNLKLEFYNAQAEQANALTIANTLVNNKVDLIYAIATPSAVAAANATSEIPIVISAVTDPQSAELVESNEKPNTNVTGSSDLAPVKAQIALIPRILPNAKTVGFIYNSSESNSKFIVDKARIEAEALGLKTVTKTVSATSEIQQVTQSLIPLCDIIYVPNDNMFATAMDAVAAVTKPAKMPVIPAETGMMEKGGIATYNTDYYQLGKMAADMAIDILVNGKKPQDMPIQYQKEFALSLNKEYTEAIGLTFPQDILDEAAAAESK